jgi:hypothetical protein
MRLKGFGMISAPAGKLAHLQALRRRFAAEAAADLALGFRMQGQAYAERRGSALARVVVGRGADAAEGEHDVARGEAALQRGGKPFRVVAVVLAPGQAQAALGERLDDEGQMLVLALADQDFIADDQRAECHAGILLAP